MAPRTAWTGVFLTQHCLRYNLNLRGSITADRCCRSPRPWVPPYNPTTPLVGYEITKDGVNRVLIMQKGSHLHLENLDTGRSSCDLRTQR